jgi:hypothetical protein
MECNSSNAVPLIYCGGVLHIGTVAADEPLVRLLDEATGRILYLSQSEEFPDSLSVDMPTLLPGHVYRLSIAGDQPFTPYAADDTPGTTEVTYIYVRFDKAFNDEGEVVGIEEQYVKLAP